MTGVPTDLFSSGNEAALPLAERLRPRASRPAENQHASVPPPASAGVPLPAEAGVPLPVSVSLPVSVPLPASVSPPASVPDSGRGMLCGPAYRIWNRELAQWRNQHKFHVILWGPPGCGKTTLAHMLGEATGLQFTCLSAVRDGVADIRRAAAEFEGQLLFIDEIHRLSKAQQDTLLPILEHAQCWVVGATTESPKVSLTAPILSRVRTIYVACPSAVEVQGVLDLGLATLANDAPSKVTESLLKEFKASIVPKVARMSQGDVRFALGLLESLFYAESSADWDDILRNTQRSYSEKNHADLMSAMIKSMRGSDPDAALFYAISALDAGEDALFILRRCIIFASEDVGNADPNALRIAVDAYKAVECVGMPEGRISLAQAVTYLASTVKSNRAYKAIDVVRRWASEVKDLPKEAGLMPPAPLTLKGKDDYKYPHDAPDAFVSFEYLPPAVAALRAKEGPAYRPSDAGFEEKLRARLARLWKK